MAGVNASATARIDATPEMFRLRLDIGTASFADVDKRVPGRIGNAREAARSGSWPDIRASLQKCFVEKRTLRSAAKAATDTLACPQRRRVCVPSRPPSE